ncbi:EpsG family protein [Fusobacterium sp. IOR10]|uniref:EpsG family protein n=1 Tax=Fusobacterium sp. IOR10 TaxID=2665157 RepID=UPI0013D3E3A3|nr:EpsG family protein [Fusobacterium sp. IOR10]
MMFFLVLSLRSVYLGADTIRYVNYFKLFSKTSFIDLLSNKLTIERGFAIFNKIVGLISDNERYFLVVTSFIILFSIIKFIYKNSNIPWLSLFLFLSLGNFTSIFNILRQLIAISILINTFGYIRDREIKKFLLFYFVAVSIHTTAVFFIIIYIIYPFKINYIYIFYSFLSSCLIYLFSNKLLNLLFHYSNKYEIRYSENLRSGNGKGMLIMLATVLFVGYFLEKLEIKKDKNYMFYHMINIAVILQIISLKFALFSRVVSYFSIGLIVFIPNIIYKIKEKNSRFIVIIVVCLLTSYYFYILLDRNLGYIVPYKFYFDS